MLSISAGFKARGYTIYGSAEAVPFQNQFLSQAL
jgi:hypothetical protein